MEEFLGFFLALFSTLAAGVVSGLRLKPYLDAGVQFTPPSFALYPALLACAFALPTVIATFWRRPQRVVTIGAIPFTKRQLFAVLWSVLYIVLALTYFPYEQTEPPLA
ncbi:MAG TPA: hypothetical protein VNN62_24260, partial [Methylomirabilota bacterium]|nr:hypothetical protein [Methylomirabilota bacterium]